MAHKDVKIEGVWLSHEAAKNVEETGCSPAEDIAALESGEHTKESLLAHCLDGADPDREAGWIDYVNAIKDNSLSSARHPQVQGVKVGPGWRS